MRNKVLLLMAIFAGLLIMLPPASASQDVGVSAILSPTDQVVLNHPYTPKSVIFNLGTEPSSFDVIFTVSMMGSPAYLVADTVSVSNMVAGTIDTVTFSDTFTPSIDTSFQVMSYTDLSADENHANDTTAFVAETFHGLAVWYGTVDGSPVEVEINHRVNVDAYVQTNDDVYIADCHLCLGFNLTYVDSLLSLTEGIWYYPFDEWDIQYFADPDFGPPAMPEGWASQSFQGFANINPPYDSPWLHSLTPIRVLTYVAKTVNDSSVIGSVANALGQGFNHIQGPSNAGDTTGDFTYPVLESHSPFYFLGAGRVTGQVTNESSSPIEGVEVVDLNSSKTTFTAADGRYTLTDLVPGLHDFSFSHPNQRDTVVTGVNIPRYGNITLNVQMRPLPVSDVGVTRIISPPAFVQQNITYPLKSEVTNFGTATSTFDVVFEAYALGASIPLVADTFTVIGLPGGQLDTVTFGETLLTSLDTTYQLVSYSLLEGDVDAGNDTTTSTSSIFFGVSAWYGNMDASPMPANIGERFGVDVYIQTVEDVYLSYIHLCLGTANQYIDSLLSRDEGMVYYPFTDWDIAQFTSPQGSPPNPDGWSSESFVGFGSIGSTPNPWLHYETPTKALTFMVKIADDLLLVGDTIQCFGTGYHSTFGPSNASDTLSQNTYPIIELFSPLYFRAVGFVAGTVLDVLDQPIPGVYVTAVGSGVEDSTDENGEYLLDSLDVGVYDILFSHPLYRDTTVMDVEVLWRETSIVDMVLSYPCDFVPGDVNGNGVVIGSDVTYAINYFRLIGPPPPDSCFNANSGSWLYSAADANGDCQFIMSDITYLLNYFRMGPAPTYCPYTPPPSGTVMQMDRIKIPINLNGKTISIDMEDKR